MAAGVLKIKAQISPLYRHIRNAGQQFIIRPRIQIQLLFPAAYIQLQTIFTDLSQFLFKQNCSLTGNRDGVVCMQRKNIAISQVFLETAPQHGNAHVSLSACSKERTLDLEVSVSPIGNCKL